MPRRRDPHARARLLDAARAVFSDRGLDRAKVADITARAQLSKGSFYLHFESKEEAFHELLAGVVSQLECLLGEASDPLLATGPDVAHLRANVDACHAKNLELYEFIWENRAQMAMVFEGGGSASYQHLIEDFALRAQRQTAALLQHGVDIGLCRIDPDLQAAAAFFAGGFDRLARQLVREVRKPDLHAMLCEVQRLFLSAIAPPESLDRHSRKPRENQDMAPGESQLGRRPGSGYLHQAIDSWEQDV